MTVSATRGAARHAGSGVTRSLADWAASVSFANLPASVIEQTKSLILDYLRATAIGAQTPWGSAIRNLMRTLEGPARSTVLVFGDRNDPPRAAFANGSFAHAADIDDTHVGAMLHPGAAVMPAAFAVAEHVDASGKDLLAAIVVGYEAAIRVALAVQPSHFHRGFQATGTCGVFGAAAAAAKLLDHDAGVLAGTLGTAGSSAGALAQFYYSGSSVKRIHGGRAAEAGVMAALLASAGILGPADVLEGTAGFAHGYADDFAPERITEGLGTAFRLGDVSVKPHATGGRSHSAVQVAFDIVAEHGIVPSQIAAIEIVIPRFVAGRLTDANPADCTAAQMSLPFTVGLAAVVAAERGADSPLDVRDYQVHLENAEVRRLARIVDCRIDDRIDAEDANPAPSHLAFVLRDGTTVGRALGGAAGNVLAYDVEAAMLRRVARSVLDDSAIDAAIAAVAGLDRSTTGKDVVRGFSSPRRLDSARPFC